MGKERYCSDCHLIFESLHERTRHAFSTGHMSDRSCIPCSRVFYTPRGLDAHKNSHQNHQARRDVDEPVSDLTSGAACTSSQIVHIETAITSLTELTMTEPLPRHFLPSWWAQSGDLEAALQQRPDHGYSWASPVLNVSVYPLLKSQLLDSERRKSDGFPVPLSVFQYGQNMRGNEVNRNNTPLPPPEAGSRPGFKTYAALVIDCEMVELEDHVQDLVSVSVVDFLSGSVVLNTLVQPVGRVKNWVTRITGVTPAVLRDARSKSEVLLQGWPEARARIFAVADSDTIFIGHALPNDLKILRIAARNVVDSTVLLAQAAFGSVERFPRRWALKIACKELMDVNIQASRKPHSPLEDTLATRELVVWCLIHPSSLLEWGNKARIEYEKEKKERDEKRAEAQRKAAEERRMKILEEEAKEEEQKRCEHAALSAGLSKEPDIVVEA
ncbi:ribonuclease H-like domain-containing protein [Xylaria bambusicola]|uniref:ribonuclease H-like domain-containing protein n=1 Tax=Xylaria bambusicola TaxID=326684 RepID=UPI0020076DD7|nr:ribonuclease H-like domain-containing protein [Xylaria bambusicola]KAI0506513.1 ribonuclease H-like domain-containing protein [Xylaria bambusicola]